MSIHWDGTTLRQVRPDRRDLPQQGLARSSVWSMIGDTPAPMLERGEMSAEQYLKFHHKGRKEGLVPKRIAQLAREGRTW